MPTANSGVTKTNSTGLVMEYLLNSDKLALLYKESDIPTYLHCNDSRTNPDLTYESANISDVSERDEIYDPGSGHRHDCYYFQL
ncbi:hypothetical protein TNCV_2127341 [Trichonephila clavipes]|nr:hypothetical protein TNCV_2127341 [Trichonephila clavipes]